MSDRQLRHIHETISIFISITGEQYKVCECGHADLIGRDWKTRVRNWLNV